jgi:DNA-binding CsgD family transcriptional regulator
LDDFRRPDAGELWETMRGTRFPFALIDPVSHRFVEANDPYAALFELQAADLKGTSLTSLFDPDIAGSVEAINNAFARRTLHVVRGQMALQKLNGKTIELTGWSRRLEGMGERPLVVTCTVEVGRETLPDDRYWVDRAPHVFGLPDGGSGPQENVLQRADHLEKLLWRIGEEVLAAGLMPIAGEKFPLGPIKELGDLTARQREVVVRLIAGERVSEIAREMFLSPSTIRNHLTAVFQKFGVHSQVELISILKDLSDRQP